MNLTPFTPQQIAEQSEPQHVSQAAFEAERVAMYQQLSAGNVAEDLSECPSFDFAEHTGDFALIGAMYMRAKEVIAERMAWRWFEHDDMAKTCDTERELAKLAAQWSIERQGSKQ